MFSSVELPMYTFYAHPLVCNLYFSYGTTALMATWAVCGSIGGTGEQRELNFSCVFEPSLLVLWCACNSQCSLTEGQPVCIN